MSLDFCTEEVKKYDYYRYLCCLLAPAELQAKLFPILAFNNEIAKIKEVTSEPMAGYIRLQWWRDAIEEIYQHAPIKHSHNVTSSLHDVIKNTNIPKNLFDDLIDAREADIDFAAPEDIDSIKKYGEGTVSRLFYIMLAAAGVDDPFAKKAAHHAGIAYAITGLLRAMKYNAYHNRVMFPLDLLNENQITADDVIAGKNLAATKIITKLLCEEAEKELLTAKNSMQKAPKETINVLLAGAIIKPFLRRIKRCDYDLFAHDFEHGKLGIQLAILKAKLLGGF